MARLCDPATIAWNADVRPAKRRNDEFLDTMLSPLLHGYQKELSVLSLPAAEWIWERRLARKNPHKDFTFYGVERNPEVKERATEVALKAGPNFYVSPHPDLDSHLEVCENVYDLAFLDFMGGPTDRKIRNVQTMVRRGLLAPDSWVITTFALSNVGPSALYQQAKNLNMAEVYALSHPKPFPVNIIDDRQLFRDNGLMEASPVIPVAERIPVLVNRLIQPYGARIVKADIHIYYNEHQGNRRAPEGSFCFHIRP